MTMTTTMAITITIGVTATILITTTRITPVGATIDVSGVADSEFKGLL